MQLSIEDNLNVLIYLELAPDGFESNSACCWEMVSKPGGATCSGCRVRVELDWEKRTGTANQRPYCV